MIDPFDLDRFVRAQAADFATALAELKAGRKRSHWMWYVFPQIAGLGSSETSRYYGVKSVSEAAAYLAHPVLGPRLLECGEAVIGVTGRSAHEIFGSPDDTKLRSSMTLFVLVPSAHPIFQQVIDQYFDGARDARTLEIVDYLLQGGTM